MLDSADVEAVVVVAVVIVVCSNVIVLDAVACCCQISILKYLIVFGCCSTPLTWVGQQPLQLQLQQKA